VRSERRDARENGWAEIEVTSALPQARQQVGHSKLRSLSFQVSGVGLVSLHLNQAHQVVPLPLRHLAARPIPKQLREHNIFGRDQARGTGAQRRRRRPGRKDGGCGEGRLRLRGRMPRLRFSNSTLAGGEIVP